MMSNRKLRLAIFCGNPANATNRERFSTAEWSDVNATYRILGVSMPSLEGPQDTAWPELCRAMHVCLKGNEAQRALIVNTDRLSWGSHEAFYGYWMVALCLRLRIVFVGHKRSGYKAYFVASVCSFRLILQRNWQ